MAPDIDFGNLRAESGDRREGFEEFSAQLFRRLVVPAGSRHERYRGAGGDGGVEAVWRLPSGTVIGLQSKYFLPLKDGHRQQLEKSLNTAIDNFPKLETYIVSLPFDPTPTVKARAGKGQVEKLEEWRKALVAIAAGRGVTLDVEWWFASDLKSRLLGMDNAAGRILYWFGSVSLDTKILGAAVKVAESVAGHRYSPKLRVGMEAGDVLRAFGVEKTWPALTAGWGKKIQSELDSWTSRAPKGHATQVSAIIAALQNLLAAFKALEALSFTEKDRAGLEEVAAAALEIAETLTVTLKSDFDRTHGADSDTPGWRQFQAEYMVAFPAAELDLARQVCVLLRDIVGFGRSSAAHAAGANVLLMRGPAGIGKTHTTIDAAKERVASGLGTVVILGEEITVANDPWLLIAKKLQIASLGTTAELLGALAAYAESTDAPFVVMIDAINETPDRARWRAWLPQLQADIADQPIRLLLTCRDIYVQDALDTAANNLATFVHDGFYGREYEAAYAFAAFYKVGPPAEVIAQPEFANPLFLHLVCRAAGVRNWEVIPGGQIGLTTLISAILDGANTEAAKLLDYDWRLENPVKEGAMALAELMGHANDRRLCLTSANAALKAVRPSTAASQSLLYALEAADLIATVNEGGEWIVRFAFERLGDVLVAQSSIDGDPLSTVQVRLLSGDLSKLFASADAIAANAGLVQAYSLILPEMFGVELVDLLSASPHHRELTRLSLGVLAWRDAGSFGSLNWVTRYMLQSDDVAEIIDQILAVAAIPKHPLNIDWLGAQLQRQGLVDRDVMWTLSITASWEKRGTVHRLVKTAINQDLSHLSSVSATLLGNALVWFTACSDRVIRDRAAQGLTRLLLVQPIAARLISGFGNSDDDYILERLFEVSYGVGLRLNDPKYWGTVAPVVFQTLFARSMPPENVLIRDAGRLIVEEADSAGVLDKSLDVSRSQPPYSSAWPLQFQNADWAAIETKYNGYPSNMMFGTGQMMTDFVKYEVKPRVDRFDYAVAGLDLQKLYQWIFEQTVSMGYPGTNANGLHYDNMLVAAHGSGRGRTASVERLGKKYARINLARLLGRLHDHVPFKTSSWDPAPSPNALQGVGWRSFDPTYFGSEGGGVAVADMAEFLPPWSDKIFSVPFRDWLPYENFDLTLAQADGQAWVLLCAHQSVHIKDDASTEERSQQRFIRSVIIPNAAMSRVRKELKIQSPHADIPDLRSLYQGEYPFGRAFAHWSVEQIMGGDPSAVVINAFEDAVTSSEDLWAPAASLIKHARLHWDGASAWLDDSDAVKAAHIREGRSSGVVIKAASLAAYLTEKDARLVWLVEERRNVQENYSSEGYVDRDSFYEWSGSKIRKIAVRSEIHIVGDEGSEPDADEEGAEI